MSNTPIVWEVPDNLYRELVKAQHELDFPNLADLISQAVQRYLSELEQENWHDEFRALQKQIRAAGGFQLGATKEEVIAKLREQRQQIFEAEYAHLYRQ